MPIPKNLKDISDEVRFCETLCVCIQEFEKFVKSRITIFNHNEDEFDDDDEAEVCVPSHAEQSEDEDYDEIDEDDYSVEYEHGHTETGEKITKTSQIVMDDHQSKILERDLLR